MTVIIGYGTDREDDDGAVNYEADNAASLEEDRLLQADAQVHADVQEAEDRPLQLDAEAPGYEDQPLIQVVRQRKMIG